MGTKINLFTYLQVLRPVNYAASAGILAVPEAHPFPAARVAGTASWRSPCLLQHQHRRQTLPQRLQRLLRRDRRSGRKEDWSQLLKGT